MKIICRRRGRIRLDKKMDVNICNFLFKVEVSVVFGCRIINIVMVFDNYYFIEFWRWRWFRFEIGEWLKLEG